MNFREGQIYEGAISLSGDDGPHRRWLVVAPFGKKHIHSVDDPMELHCWPLSVLRQGFESGRLRYVALAPEHPQLQLQRLKEAERISDSHLGLGTEALERMFDLLEQAVAEGADLAPFAAGEIIALTPRSIQNKAELTIIQDRVAAILANARQETGAAH